MQWQLSLQNPHLSHLQLLWPNLIQNLTYLQAQNVTPLIRIISSQKVIVQLFLHKSPSVPNNASSSFKRAWENLFILGLSPGGANTERGSCRSNTCGQWKKRDSNPGLSVCNRVLSPLHHRVPPKVLSMRFLFMNKQLLGKIPSTASQNPVKPLIQQCYFPVNVKKKIPICMSNTIMRSKSKQCFQN